MSSKKKTNKKVIILIAVLLVVVIAAVAGIFIARQTTKGSDNVYTALYESEVSTLNYLITSNTWDMTVGANVVDTLVEYDSFANMIPGLAESWEESEDQLTWTFHLRKGVKWYDHNGKEIAEVTAHDFVSALKYVLTAEYESSVSYLVVDAANIVNAAAYENGEITDFSQVGVKALDDYTLQYTVSKPTPYFPSCTTYGCFMPAYGPQLEELGAEFATDNEKMYYCGAFILSKFEPQVTHVYTKNANNWDAEHVYIDGIERRYVPDSSATAPMAAMRGEVDSASLSNDIVEQWMTQMPNQVVRDRAIPDYSYFYAFNFDPQYEEEYAPKDWLIAVNNSNFRHSIMSAFDRLYALGALEPNDPASVLQNTITPATFAEVDNTDFTLLPPFEGVGDNFFNTEKALAYKAEAVKELTAAGVKFPIQMVVTYKSGDSDWESESILLKQQLEGVLGSDYINVVLYAGPAESFLNKTRRAGMYSFMRVNWGGDFVDPATWTDPFAESLNDDGTHKGNSYNKMDKMLDGDEYPATKALLQKYYAAVADAKNVTNDTSVRYNKFAEAERMLIDNAMVVPFTIMPAGYQLTKLNIFEGQYAPFGVSNLRFKHQHLHEDFITIDEYNAAQAAWLEGIGQK